MNQKGFITIGLIIVLPLILMMFFSGFWIIWFLNQKNQIENLCHLRLLEAQKELIRGNQEVLTLNPKAKWLFIEKKALTIVIHTAPPQIKAAALIRRRMVIAQQKLLAKKQKGILYIRKYKSKGKLIKFRRDFKQQLSNISQFWRTGRTPFYELNIQEKNSAIRTKLKDIAPTYWRAPSHTRSQTLFATWNIHIRSFLPPWLLELVPVQKVWHGQCYTHPHKGGLKWTSRIGKGNHF